MKLFINDIPITLIENADFDQFEKYDVVYEGSKDKITSAGLIDDVLIHNATLAHIDLLLKQLAAKKLKKLDSISMTVSDLETAKEFVKSKFTIIKAGGGIVRKGDRHLLIYRIGKWDLPKGKLEKGEKPKVGAKREVEEECNIKVLLKDKICSTWHSYTRNGKNILKKTNWYLMDCVDDSQMKPQIEEDIEDVRWLQTRELNTALYNSYPSIRYVFKMYYQVMEKLV
jgi:8-oxo-dGTP pyrophosphatase MutT (NUDIX family)